jgi:hypothetical protein
MAWNCAFGQADSYGRLVKVDKWVVDLHLVYTSEDGDHHENATSDWTGTLNADDAIEGRYYADVDVAVDGTTTSHAHDGDHQDLITITAKGHEKYAFSITIEKDGYQFDQGYCNTEFGHRHLDCPKGNGVDDDGAISYSVPWRVKQPLPSSGLTLSGSTTINSSSAVQNDPPLRPGTTFVVTWDFHPAGMDPELKAVPTVASTVMRGETLILDGTKSTGKPTDYIWTFRSRAAAAGDTPNEKSEKHGAKTSVVLLASMDITLAVTDGNHTDKKTISAKVTPRSYFRTRCEHVEPESYLPDGTPPIATQAGISSKGSNTYDASWVGAENVCAIDPPAANSDEPPHVFHPDPKKASRDEIYSIVAVSDSNGPWDGFYYFKDWKIQVKRRARMNSFIVESGPGQSQLGGMNFYTFNLGHNGDVKGYLKAARAHEKEHSSLMFQTLMEDDPALTAEKSYGKSQDKLHNDIKDRLGEMAEKMHDHAKDPLPETWKGLLALPVKGRDEWVLVETKVGGEGYGAF